MPEHRGETFVMREEGPSGPITFSAFILGLASNTLIHLGDTANPETGQAQLNLELARQTLDLLELLRVKTQGNLASDEERLFASLLTDLRLRFVHLSGK